MASIPDNVLDDVLSRFVLPEHKQGGDSIRLCFAIEMGYWFYLDNIRILDPSLPDCTNETFAKRCFRYFPHLLKRSEQPDIVLKQWKEFKRKVPVYGAIMITPNRDKVLLVEGNSTKGCWTFPRGKIEENEDQFDCAVREVVEETSFDISQLGNRGLYIDKILSDRQVRLYIVYNVPETTLFFPKVKGEIASIKWFNFVDLPGSASYNSTAPTSGRKREQFYMVNPFVREILKKSKERSRGNSHRSDSESRDQSFLEDKPNRTLLNMPTKNKPVTKIEAKPHQNPLAVHQPHPVHQPQARHPIVGARKNKTSLYQPTNMIPHATSQELTTPVPPNHFSQNPTMPSQHHTIPSQGSPKRSGGGSRRGRGRRGVSTVPQEQSLRNFQLDLKPLIACLPDRRVREE